jgi:hypothetical protein
MENHGRIVITNHNKSLEITIILWKFILWKSLSMIYFILIILMEKEYSILRWLQPEAKTIRMKLKE